MSVSIYTVVPQSVVGILCIGEWLLALAHLCGDLVLGETTDLVSEVGLDEIPF